MGAYENPITAIDTKSGEIWANAARGISNSISNAILRKKQNETDQQKKAQEEIDFAFQYTLSNRNEVSKRLSEAGVTNDQPFELAYEIMNKKNSFELDAKRAKTLEDQNELLTKAGKYDKALNNFYVLQKSMLANDDRFKEEYINNIDKVGQEGGVPLIGKENKKYNLAMSIRNGINPGDETFEYDEDSGSWNAVYTGARISENGFDKIVMPVDVLANYDPGKIPEISKKINSLFSQRSDKNPQGLSINGTDGYPSDEYLDFKNVTYIYSEDGKFRTPVIPAKTEQIVNASKIQLTSQAQGFLSDPSTAQVVWQNLLAKKGDPEDFKITANSGGFFSEKDQELFIQRYVEKGSEYIKPFKYGTTEPVPVVKTTTTKEGVAQMKIYDKAKNLTDDLLRANSKKNQDYFVGKTIKGGKEIQSAKWEGDNLVLTTIDTSGSNSFEEETVYNMNRRERVETMVADFVKENYGKDASSEDIRDMATKILRERQARRQPKINTSYK